jgi:hypothetical protein
LVPGFVVEFAVPFVLVDGKFPVDGVPVVPVVPPVVPTGVVPPALDPPLGPWACRRIAASARITELREIDMI